MKKMMAGLTATVFVLMLGSTLLAHHSLSQFDTTTAVRVKGVIVQFVQVNPHSILFMDQKSADGQIQRWAVEGPSTVQLNRRGFAKEAFKVGDVVEACGYVTKAGVESQRTISAESVGSATTRSISGRLLTGE